MFNINLMNFKKLSLYLVLAISIVSVVAAQNSHHAFINTTSDNDLINESKSVNNSKFGESVTVVPDINHVDNDDKSQSSNQIESQPLPKKGHKQNELVEIANESFPCMNWCRYTDTSLDECWKHSLKHHAVELLRKVEDLYSALLHVDHWKRSNSDDPEKDGYKFETEIMEEALGAASGSHGSEVNEQSSDEERSKFNETVLREIFKMVFEEFKSKKDIFHSEKSEVPSLPPLACPIPCDYYPRMWMTLTALVSLTLMLVIIVVLVYLFCDSWSPRRRGKWRLV